MTRSLLAFFSLTFAAAWLAWGAAAAIGGGAPAASPRGVLSAAVFLLGVFAPGLVGLALTERAEGRAASRALLGRIFRWQVDARWYLFAVAYIPVVKLLAALAHRLLAGEWPRFGATPWFAMAAAIVVSTWVQAGEEVGWRGYALPRLSRRFGLGPAGILLGVVWAAWHLPLFFAFPAGSTFGQSFPLYLLQVTALSVAAAWLYWRTGASLLLVMLLHAAVNNTTGIVPSGVPGAADPFAFSASLVAWLTTALLWIAAAFFLVRMRGISALPEAEAATRADPAVRPAAAAP